MTRKVLLLCVLPTAALGLVPAAASAHTLSGHCDVTGTATFTPPLMGASQNGHFDFQSGSPGNNNMGQNVPDGTKCSGTLDGQQMSGPVSIHVAGDGSLGCLQSSGTNALGAITFPNGVAVPFKMDFSGIATEVSLTVKSEDGSQAGTGNASFRNYAGPTTPIDCNNGGVQKLGFDASADVTNLKGGPAPSSGPSPSVGASTQPPSQSTAPACVVPNLKGKTVAAAKKALTAANCRLGKVTRKANRKMKKGRVFASKPKAGTHMAAKSKVAVTVSA